MRHHICRSPRTVICFLALALLTSAPSAHARVTVQSTDTILNVSPDIRGGNYIAYPVSLSAGEQFYGEVRASGGLDNAIQVWVTNLNNFQLLKGGYKFNYYTQASPRVAGGGRLSFAAPETDVYYIVLDNRRALFARHAGLYVYKVSDAPNEWTNEVRTVIEGRYNGLKKLFIFPDFDISVAPCGIPNAHSNPNISICSELIEAMQAAGAPEAERFAFLHEVAHSLLYLWNYPDFDNEDSADQFATVMLMLFHQESSALQAAQWWAAQDSLPEERAHLIFSDRHSLSIQRARNILDWLNRKDDLERRWLHVLIPNMQDEALRAAMVQPITKDAGLLQLIREELQRRHPADAQASGAIVPSAVTHLPILSNATKAAVKRLIAHDRVSILRMDRPANLGGWLIAVLGIVIGGFIATYFSYRLWRWALQPKSSSP
jgi:hypothetical protein